MSRTTHPLPEPRPEPSEPAVRRPRRFLVCDNCGVGAGRVRPPVERWLCPACETRK